MTVTVKAETIGKYLVEIESNKFTCGYTVAAYENISGFYGYPITEIYYPTMKQASRRFSDLKRKAARGEL